MTNHRFLARAAIAALVLPASLTVHAALAYNAPVNFNRPGYESTQPWAINDSGVIVGASDGVGFVYSGGLFTSIAHPSADSATILTGVSNSGTLVGNYLAGSTSASFVYDRGSFTAFALPGQDGTEVRGISGNGRYLAGTYSGNVGGGFVYDRDHGTYRLVENSATSSVIVQGVNDSGLAVGSVSDRSTGVQIVAGITVDAASGARTEIYDIGAPSGPRFRGINNDGTLVGWVSSGSAQQAFVGEPAGGWLLNMAQAPADATGAFAYGINGADTVIGFYNTASGLTRGWVATPVPEPAVWALFAIGLAAVGAASRRHS